MTSNSGANADIEGHDAACEGGERENRAGGCAGSDLGEDADPSLDNSRRDLQQLNQSLDSWHQFPAEATPSSIWNKNLQGGNQKVLVPEDGDGEADRLLVGRTPAVEDASTAVGAAEAGSAAVSVGAAPADAALDTDVVVADDTRNVGVDKQVEDKADKSEDDLDHIIGRSANMTMPDGAGFGAPAMTDEVDENSAGGTTTSAGADGNCGNHHISTSSCNSSLGASGSGSRGSGSAQMKSSSRGKNMQSFNPPPRPLTSSTPQHQYNQHRGPRGSGGSTYNHSYAAGTAGGSTTNKGNGKKGGHGGCGGYKNQQYHQHHAVAHARGQQQHGHINQNHNQLQQRRGGPGYGQHQQQHQQGGGGGAYHNQHTNSRFGGQRGQQGGNNYDSYGAPTTTSAQQHNVAHATTHPQHNPNSHSSTTPTTYSFNQHAAERYRSSQGSSYNGAPGVQNNNQQWHNQHQNSSNSRHQEGGHNYGQQHQHGEMMNNGGGAPVSTWSSSSGGAAGATSTYQQMHGSYHQQQQSQNGTASMGNQHTCTSTTPGYPHQGDAQHHQLHQNHNLHQQVAQQQPQNQGQNMVNQPHQQQHNVMPNNSGASSHQVDHADHLHQEQLLLQQQQQQVHHQSNVNLNMNNNQHQPPLIQQPQHSFVPNGGGPAAQIPPFSAGGGTAGGMTGTSGTTSSNMDGKSMNYHVQLEKAVRSKRVEEAWATLEEMQFEGIVCDKFAISRILMKTVNHYHEPKLLQRGIQVVERFVHQQPGTYPRLLVHESFHDLLVQRGIQVVERFVHQQPGDVDEVLFNSLLDACCRTRDMARLESILRQMRANGIQPSSVTLGILVKAYGQAGDIDSVWREWLRLKESLHENANAVTFGCMLDACVKCGDIEKALFVFQDIKRIGKHHNTILYTTLMKGYGMARNLEGALMLFNEMKQERVAVNTITFNSMIDVAVRAHDCDKAEELYRELEQTHGIEPDLITYSTLIKGFCQIGHLEKALTYMRHLRERGLSPDELVFNSLLDGCVKANDLQTGIRTFEELTSKELHSQIGSPSHVTYQILVRLYRRCGYSETETEAHINWMYAEAGLSVPKIHPRGPRTDNTTRSSLIRRQQQSRNRKNHIQLQQQAGPAQQLGGQQGGTGAAAAAAASPQTQTSGVDFKFLDATSMSMSNTHASNSNTQSTASGSPVDSTGPGAAGIGGGPGSGIDGLVKIGTMNHDAMVTTPSLLEQFHASLTAATNQGLPSGLPSTSGAADIGGARGGAASELGWTPFDTHNMLRPDMFHQTPA